MFSGKKLLVAMFATGLLSACGGSGSDDKTSEVIEEGYAYCSVPDANERLYNYMKRMYFWESELTETFDPEGYEDIATALDALRVEKDRFSFSMSTEEYEDYQASIFFGYGFSHTVTEEEDALLIRYVYEAGTPYAADLRRGDKMVEIDGTPMSQIIAEVKAGTKTFGDYFGPNEDGYTITIKFEKPNGDVITADISKAQITANTVMHDEVKEVEINGTLQNVGYLVFNSFDGVSESELNTSFDTFATYAGTESDGIDQLILDLRYNGGGLIRVANQLSTQIAGDAVEGDVFVQYRYNDKNTDKNASYLFDIGQGVEKMNLDKVIVLTSEGSCSSSELVINSLKPHIEVVTIGNQTCGKPVGMSPTQVCNDVVFAINFDSVNSAGEGEYYNGLPVDCQVDEVVTGDWGVETDPMLAEGLNYLKTGACSPSGKKFGSVTATAQKSRVPTIDWTKGPLKAQNLL